MMSLEKTQLSDIKVDKNIQSQFLIKTIEELILCTCRELKQSYLQKALK